MKVRILVLLLLSCSFVVNAQRSFRGQIGFGYQEHLAISGGYSLNKNYTFSLLYGSNFFIRTDKFSTLFLQLDRTFNKPEIKDFYPHIGIKAGNVVFSDTYYKWKVISFIPFGGLNYTINKNTGVFIESGPAISFKYNVVRIKSGEIGHYRTFLPEIKIGLNYFLNKK